MNRTKVKSLLSLFAGCLLLLASCSSEQLDAPESASRVLTYQLSAPGAKSSLTRSMWQYDTNPYKEDELLFTWGDEEEISVLYAPSVASHAPMRVNGTKATVQLEVSGGETPEQVLFVYPEDDDLAYGTDGVTLSLPNLFVQTAESTEHLKPYTYLTAVANVDDADVALQHQTAVIRFIVRNKRQEPVTLQSVSLSGSVSLSEQVLLTGETKVSQNGESLAVQLDGDWSTIACNKNLTAYALCFSTNLSLKDNYKIYLTDSEGKTYMTEDVNIEDFSTVDGDGNVWFQPGYYYTFYLLLDDTLTLSEIKSSSNLTWGAKDDEQDL